MIRQAKLSDFDAIVHIRESVALDITRLEDKDYRVQIQRSGFLLPTGLGIEEFRADVSSYSVAEREGQVAGYLRLTEEQEVPPEAEAFWLRPDIRDVYYSRPHAYIWGIGVLPEAKHHGMATEMLQTAERQSRARNAPWLFSEIVTSPVTNLASLLFHEKYGFERIALGEPKQAYGMEGFQNLVYGKRL
jgi:ribosomal protein S18 acetylase RimI-like enzyme